ncbi:zinc ribbon domain-containing protein [Nocardioides sp. JQ2195]|uniref:zinc ribbon domain-containing protein n=1 Tax=Nocardioides sp. JQ2195 TaxID=2592334 RepID=UPI00197E45BC|nr:zinc ribbon domain-containing protein [Nocardioides sp. JQ2195]
MSQCPQCGTATTEGQPFCGACGATLATQTPAPDPDAGKTQIREQRPSAQQPGQGQWGQPAAPQQPAPQSPPQQQWGQQPPAPQHQPQHQPPGQPQWGQPQAPQGHYAPQGQQQYAGPQGQQYPAPQGQYAGPQGGGKGVGFDFSRMLAGNWVGAAGVAGAALAVAFIGSALFAFTTMEKFDFVEALAMTIITTVSVFGANSVVHNEGGDGDFSFEATQNLGQFPLLVTVLAFAAAVWMFRRMTAAHRNVVDGLLDAARAALILTLGVTILAIVMRIWSPEITGYIDDESSDIDTGPSGLGFLSGDSLYNHIGGAIFVTLLLTLTVLAITCFVRRDWLSEKAQLVNDWLRVPMIGIAAVAAVTALAGVIYLIAIIVGNDDARGFGEIMRLIAVTPALGLRLVSLGVFSNVGWAGSGDGEDEEKFDRLGGFADDNGVLFWIAPLIALAVMAAGVYAVVMKSLDKTKIMRHTLVYLGLLLIAMPFLVRFSNAHIGAEQEFDGDSSDFDLWMGVDGFQTTMFFFLFSIVVAAVVLLVTGNLDVNAIKAKASSFQSQPGAQPGQQQWGQQPGTGPQQPQQGGQWGQPQPPQQGGQQWGQQPGTGPQQPQQGGQWGQPQPPQQGGQQWGQQPGTGPQQPQQGGQWGQPQPPQQPPYGQQPPQQGGWQPPTQ